MAQKKNKQQRRKKQPQAQNLQATVRNAVQAGLKSLPKGTFKALGTVIGAKMGHPALGGTMGNALSRFTGYGDYVANNLVKSEGYDGQSIPKFGSAKGGTRITHAEYLGDIASSTSFNANVFRINPGDARTFPWLSQIADGYEKYRFRSLIFTYRSISSEYSTTQTLGAVIAAAQYDVLDPSFTSKSQMENYHTAISTKPSNNLLFGVECKPSSTAADELYLRYGPTIPANADARLYDLANVTIATQGMNATQFTAGEWWVSYDVELFYPNINFSSYGTSTILYHGFTNTASATNIFNGLVTRYSNMNTAPTGSNNVLSFPSTINGGVINLLVYVYSQTAVTTAGGALSNASSTNCAPIQILNNAQSNSISTGWNVGTFRLTFQCLYGVSGASPTITLNAPAAAAGTSYTGTEVFAILCPYDLN